MRYPAALFACAVICVVSCQTHPASRVWRKVVLTPRPTQPAEDPSRVYAAELHGVLLAERVPHQIVTVEFSYSSEYRPHGTAQRTVVVYRDRARRGEGWWIMDERLRVPVWLPDRPLDVQIGFYLGRPVTVVSVNDYLHPGDGKDIIPFEVTPAKVSGTPPTDVVSPHEIAAYPAPKPVSAKPPVRRIAKTEKKAVSNSGSAKPSSASVKKATKPDAKPKLAQAHPTQPKAKLSVPPKSAASTGAAKKPASTSEDKPILKPWLEVAPKSRPAKSDAPKPAGTPPLEKSSPVKPEATHPTETARDRSFAEAEAALVRSALRSGVGAPARPGASGPVVPRKTAPSEPALEKAAPVLDEAKPEPAPEQAPRTSLFRRFFQKAFRA